jgi:hypothetical protein
MTKAGKTIVIFIAALVTTLVVIVLALFHGYFDRGKFEVRNAQWSTSGQVAVLAERSDHNALSSDIHFVLIGDHLFSPSELRRAYYSPAVIFATAGECLTLRWRDTHNLAVTCTDGSIDQAHINVQQRRSGDVDISYVNIPDRDAIK